MRERANAHRLDQLVFRHASADFAFQPGIFVTQAITCLLQFQVGVHAREHDCRNDWFGDVVHGAQLKALQLILLVAAGREKDDRDLCRTRRVLEFLQHPVAVHAGHHDIKQD